MCQTHSCLLMFTFHSGLKNHYSSKSAFNLNLELKNNNINIKERGLSWCYLAQQWRPTKEHSPCPLPVESRTEMAGIGSLRFGAETYQVDLDLSTSTAHSTLWTCTTMYLLMQVESYISKFTVNNPKFILTCSPFFEEPVQCHHIIFP